MWDLPHQLTLSWNVHDILILITSFILLKPVGHSKKTNWSVHWQHLHYHYCDFPHIVLKIVTFHSFTFWVIHLSYAFPGFNLHLLTPLLCSSALSLIFLPSMCLPPLLPYLTWTIVPLNHTFFVQGQLCCPPFEATASPFVPKNSRCDGLNFDTPHLHQTIQNTVHTAQTAVYGPHTFYHAEVPSVQA